jgi:hypothetical protein
MNDRPLDEFRCIVGPDATVYVAAVGLSYVLTR